MEMESVSISKTAARTVVGYATARSARTVSCSARGELRGVIACPGLWHAADWRGRAGQALEASESGMTHGTTADSLAADRRGPQKDSQVIKTKSASADCLWILVQCLGPTRARNFKESAAGTAPRSAALREGGLDIPAAHARCGSLQQRTPNPDV